jgi:cysteinyl-tRNA synthetase
MTDPSTSAITAPATDAELVIYNTLSRRKEPFSTIEPGRVRMYVCGVTVYDEAHIGHAFTFIVFDVIRRYLEHLGYEVDHVQNYTDIDDKIINRANAEGLDPTKLTEDLIENWSREVLALNLLPADIYPRATQEVPEIIAMIEGLIERGHAYAVDGDVYFRVRSFPDYGKLSGRDVDDLRDATSTTSARAHGSRLTSARRTRSISPSGRPRSRASRAGPARGATAGRGGTSSARPCRCTTCTASWTSTAAAPT